MEVVSRLVSRSVVYGLNFILLTMLGWACFLVALACPARAGLPEMLVFLSGATLCAWILLRPASFPDSLRILPRKSDLFMVCFAIPAGGVIALYVLRKLFGFTFVTATEIAMWSPLMAVCVFGYYYLLSFSGLSPRMRRRVVLDLQPTERAALLADFASIDLDRNLSFLSRADLSESLLKGEGEEIDLIVTSRPMADSFHDDSAMIRAHLSGIPILDFREVSSKLSGRISLSHLDVWAFITGARSYTPLLKAFIAVKTAIEPLLAVILGVVLAPLMAAVAIAIKIDSRGPVFYTQARTGYRGKTFTLVKFRSMRIDAESNGIQWASSDDPRVTAVGRFLRKTRLDEIPQLWNVINGDMSFIGPRPERPEIYKALKTEIPLFGLRTMIRPGITGWAQVCAGYAASVAESATKLEYDLFYIQNVSPRLDIIILLKTLLVAVVGEKSNKKAEVLPAEMMVKTS